MSECVERAIDRLVRSRRRGEDDFEPSPPRRRYPPRRVRRRPPVRRARRSASSTGVEAPLTKYAVIPVRVGNNG